MLRKNIEFSTEYLILTIYNMAIFDIKNVDQDIFLEKCKQFYKKYKLNLRIYKTRNGYRVFITNDKFHPINNKRILLKYGSEIFADQRYIIMINQKYLFHFSARISPKYLNILYFPFEKSVFFKKYKEYEEKNEAITKYLTSIGDGKILEEFDEFIKDHDIFTKAFNKDFMLV